MTPNGPTTEVRTVATLLVLVAEKWFEDMADNSSLIFVSRIDNLFILGFFFHERAGTAICRNVENFPTTWRRIPKCIAVRFCLQPQVPRSWSFFPSQCILHIYLLTYSMVQSPSWEANWFAASQEIPRISRNPKVHYRTHKRPPPVSILYQPNPVHIPTSHLLENHPNTIHPSTPRSPLWSPSLQFPHQDPILLPLLTHTRHMPSPSHSSRFYHPHNIGWGVQII